MPPRNPRNDPWLTVPIGVFALVFAAAAFAQRYVGIGAALLVNAVLALGWSTVLVRRRRARDRERASFAETAENLWVPFLLGLVTGATVGSVVHGAPGKQMAIGALAGAWVMFCTTFALVYADWWLGSRRRGSDAP